MKVSVYNKSVFCILKKILLIIFIFSSLIANAQQNKSDSLQKLIAATKTDTAKIDLYAELGDAFYTDKKMDSSVFSYLKAIQLNQQYNYSPIKLCWNTAALDYRFYEMGNYAKSLDYAERNIVLSSQLKDTTQIAAAYMVTAHNYKELGDYQKALDNYLKAFDCWINLQIGRHERPRNTYITLCISQVYLKMNMLDSALVYAKKGYTQSIEDSAPLITLLARRIIGDIFFAKGDDETALHYYRQYVPDYITYKETNRDLGFVLNSMAGIFLKRKQNDSAAFYADKALENAENFHDQQNIYGASQLLYIINDSLKNESKALKYLKIAQTAKDSMANIEKVRQIQILSFNEEVREKEQQEADAKEAARDRLIIIISTILVAIATSLIWYRIRQLRLKYKTILEQKEAEKLKVKYEKQLLELEARALRAQMNPHFIFNCMNSIKALVQKNEDDKAVTYLTTFSKLIRTIFQNSDKREITLFDEMETCKLYTQLESMRFGKKFSYHFTIDETIDLKSVQVPALIIQPFIENAIWHGIMPKEEGGILNVSITKKEDSIYCTIDDDGLGREISKQNKFKGEASTHQSKGVHLTQSRLDLNNALNQRNAALEIIDKKDTNGRPLGTKVILTFIEF